MSNEKKAIESRAERKLKWHQDKGKGTIDQSQQQQEFLVLLFRERSLHRVVTDLSTKKFTWKSCPWDPWTGRNELMLLTSSVDDHVHADDSVFGRHHPQKELLVLDTCTCACLRGWTRHGQYRDGSDNHAIECN